VLLQNWINEELWNTVQAAPGAIDALKRLHGCGANLTFQHSDPEHKEWSIMHLAAAKSDLAVLRWLVSLNLDFNVRNGDGHSPLMVATVEGKTEVLEYLVALGANLQVLSSHALEAMWIWCLMLSSRSSDCWYSRRNCVAHRRREGKRSAHQFPG